MRRHSKRILSAILGLTMVVGLSGCGANDNKTNVSGGYKNSSTTKAMVVGDYDINMDEMIMYSMQTAYMSDTKSESLTDVSVNTNKKTVLSLIRTNKIIYNVAVQNGCTLEDKDIDYVNNYIDGFKSRFPAEFLDEYGIGDDIITKVFTEQAMVSKYENDIKNDIGTNVQAGLEEELKDTKFHTLYYMLFPTVEIEDGNPTMDDNNNYIYVSDDEKEKVLERANEATERIKNGESYEDIAKEYEVTEYSGERAGYADAYTDKDVAKAISELKDGECMEPYEDTLGYAVVVMIDSDNPELKESYISNYTSNSVSTQFDELEQKWLGTIKVDEAADMEGTVWADFDYKTMVEDLEAVGAIKTE